MGIAYNPKIVTDNLSLLLDVSNTKSYPGSGTSWYDLSSNRLTFASAGTQTPLETVGGVQSFGFNGSGYWECGTGFSAVDFGGDCTLIMWLRSEGLAVRNTVFEKAGTSYVSYQQEIAVTWETNESFSYYSRFSPAYDYGGTTVIPLNTWTMVGIKMSTGKLTTPRTGFYSINGAAWTGSYTSNSNTAIVPAGAIRVGGGYAGTVGNGNIASVMCYNKMLSDVEINQNFNALRGRFGI